MRLSLMIILAAFVIQLAVDCFHSLTLYPFVHYGMFSTVFPTPGSQNVYVITVNGDTLHAADFSAVHWDMIQEPLVGLERQIRSDDHRWDKEQLHRGLSRAGMAGFYDRIAPNLSNAPDLPARFPAWYRDYLGRLLSKPVRTLTVDKEQVRYDQGRLIPFKKENWIKIG